MLGLTAALYRISESCKLEVLLLTPDVTAVFLKIVSIFSVKGFQQITSCPGERHYSSRAAKRRWTLQASPHYFNYGHKSEQVAYPLLPVHCVTAYVSDEREQTEADVLSFPFNALSILLWIHQREVRKWRVLYSAFTLSERNEVLSRKVKYRCPTTWTCYRMGRW